MSHLNRRTRRGTTSGRASRRGCTIRRTADGRWSIDGEVTDYTTLEAALDEVWHRLERADDAEAPAREPRESASRPLGPE